MSKLKQPKGVVEGFKGNDEFVALLDTHKIVKVEAGETWDDFDRHTDTLLFTLDDGNTYEVELHDLITIYTPHPKV